jgi:sigma-B regulation protein RsbU (phosphoserine phosphatase)
MNGAGDDGQAGTTDRHTFSSAFLHDIRTPLNQIIGYSELLAEQAEEEGQAGFVPDLQRIQTAGRQLLALLTRGEAIVTPPAESVNAPQVDHTSAHTPSPKATVDGEHLILGGASGRILIVDDNEMNRDVLARPLVRQGYEVETAENGRIAMDMVRAHPFDLVLLDIMMPEMDGYQVLQEIKRDEMLRHLPVIMISALDELDSVVRCIEMGADDYLPKPFNPTILKARLGASLEKKRAHDRERFLFHQLQEQYKREQRIAGALQRPLTLEIAENSFAGLAVATLFEPPTASEAEIGGDFFDAFALPGENVALAVADASGKGLAAAARTMQVKDVLRAFARDQARDVNDVVARLNDYVCETKRGNHGRDDHESFVCLGLVILDPATGVATALSAGAESPLILRADGRCESIMVSGMPLGVSSGEIYRSSPVQLECGDTLILLTDGLTEARRGRDFLGPDGVIALARQGDKPGRPLREMASFIMNGAREFAGGILRDDACLLLARRP